MHNSSFTLSIDKEKRSKRRKKWKNKRFKKKRSCSMHCGNNIEITKLFLHFPNLHAGRQALLSNIREINEQILSQDKFQLAHLLLYGNPNFGLIINRLINKKILRPTSRNILFQICEWLKLFIPKQQEKLLYIYIKLRQFLGSALIVNVYFTLYWFFMRIFFTVWKN